jgi:hypothetical protein
MPQGKYPDAHRGLGLTSPLTTGKDVKALQHEVNKWFDHVNVDRHIKADGEFGPATMSAVRQCAYGMGVSRRNRKLLINGRVTVETQRLIRGRKKTRREAVATRLRRGYRKKLRRQYERTGGELALAEAKRLIGTTEQPDGSNWGGMVETMIKFTGYTSAVYWCGCFACWCVVKAGGAKIPARIRLGFDGFIKGDAASHENGLVAVGFSEARAGDIVTYTFPHIGVVDHLNGATLETVEGNTSPEGSDGSQSNGGGVYPRRRSQSEVACIARPNYS